MITEEDITLVTNDEEEFTAKGEVLPLIESLTKIPGCDRTYKIDIPADHLATDFLELFSAGNNTAVSNVIANESLPSLLNLSKKLKIPTLEQYCLALLSKEQIVPKISWQEVQRHSSRNDCWLVIDNCVYDVTSWLPKHPGGESLLQGIGKDATYYFEIYHRSLHSIKLLKEYFIGILDHPQEMHSVEGEEPSELFLQRLRASRSHPT